MTFFSGTDWSQLHDRGAISNYFLMLIVNFKGDWIAKVAFPAVIKQEVRKKKFRKVDERTYTSDRTISFVNNSDGYNNLVFAIPDSDKEKVVEENVDEDNVETVEKTVLIVMDCDVVKEALEEQELDPFFERYQEVVEAIREEKSKVTVQYPHGGYHGNSVNYGAATLGGSVSGGGGYPKTWDSAREEGEDNGKQKRISEMTDQEWKETQGRLSSEPYLFDYRHARAFLNAAVGYGDVVNARMDFREPIKELCDYHRDARASDYSFWLGNLTTDFTAWMDSNYPEATDEEMLSMIGMLLGYCARFMHMKIIRDIADEFREMRSDMSIVNQNAADRQSNHPQKDMTIY